MDSTNSSSGLDSDISMLSENDCDDIEEMFIESETSNELETSYNFYKCKYSQILSFKNQKLFDLLHMIFFWHNKQFNR